MTIKKETIEHLLNLDRYKVDEKQAHIIIDSTICAKCSTKPCLVVCPAGAYVLEGDQVQFSCAGCLECGTCRVICPNGGITQWEYPRSSFGINYRNG
ncbi:Ferredoxin-like protein FixX [bioreactor metagenome]|uniref:Ferredoxin-like protein FixX n=1 Tax=bioreactor metagenome TaxID=1076179 RepID=A0A644TM26_9ZZZZ|nr:ferredoxin family protein [Negativicutes bacterium]